MFSIIGGERERVIQRAELLRRARADADAGTDGPDSARNSVQGPAARTAAPK
jgi:hypothetical protein